MGSELMDKLPTIDFGKLEMKPGSDEWNSVRDQVYKALEEYGSFEAILDATLIPKERLYEKLKEVYSSSLETKFKDTEHSVTSYGKSPVQAPLYERLNIRNVLNPGVIESISKTICPNGEQEFCDLVHTYSKRLSELDEMVRKMMFDKLGLENFWDDYKNSLDCVFSIFKYRVPKSDETNLGLPAHTDKQISTILSQHQIGVTGLQVMKKNGQWLDVEYSSTHSFIFLVNDCLTALTNGRIHSPYHRVIMGEKERYSVAVATGFSGSIKVPEELVDEDHPLLYKPFDALKYLEFCLYRPADHTNTLQTFCGV